MGPTKFDIHMQSQKMTYHLKNWLKWLFQIFIEMYGACDKFFSFNMFVIIVSEITHAMIKYYNLLILGVC